MPPGLCDLECGANKAWTAEDVRIEVTRGHVIEAWANRGGTEATGMSESPRVESVPRVTDEQWQAILGAARDLAEKVSGLSHRLAVVEQRVNSGDRPVSVRPWPSDR